MQHIKTDAPEIVRKAVGRDNERTEILTFDSTGEFADYALANIASLTGYGKSRGAYEWNGNLSFEQAVTKTREGDLASVAKSDTLLAKFEEYEIPTARKAWSDDVCGSIPNVPAFIAGHPLAMRRRIRQDSAAAPLAIIADTTTSAMVEAAAVQAHGCAVLALVRALAAVRPIELWVGGGLDTGSCRGGTWAFVRIDTAPIDLARAAHMLTHPSVTRRLIYGAIKAVSPKSVGAWPYNSHAASRNHMEACIAPAFTHMTETLCIPGLYGSDASVNDPVKWIGEQLERHRPVDLAA